MTWSYDETNLGTDTEVQRINSVRALIRDTETANQQLQDEEIAFYLSQTSDDIYSAASMSCEALAALYARYGDTSIDNGGISVNYKDVAESYRALSTQMQKLGKRYGSVGFGRPSAGGISRDKMHDVYQNTDRVDPAFKHRQFRNPLGLGDEDDDDRIR